MICACIDIGTNTTRVLVADARRGRLSEVLQRRAFTRIGRDIDASGRIGDAKIAEVARVVAEQRRLAEQAGAGPLRVVATGAIRTAANGDELLRAVREAGGVDVHLLDGEEEARLAFVGATRTAARPLGGRVGVVDVGGGSTEIGIGTVAQGMHWSTSLRFGSGLLADRYLKGDPPGREELAAVRAHAAAALAETAPPVVDRAIAVGGSAASLVRVVGAVLDGDALERALAVLTSAPAAEVARRHGLDGERVRLLPAGILALDAARERLRCPLEIGRGGLREGVLLELAACDDPEAP
jgi:exopolyphosphatase/guanosine-5'-triphosphate,3'-diphosphate pyrophosphatase